MFCAEHRQPGMEIVGGRHCSVPDCPGTGLYKKEPEATEWFCRDHKGKEGFIPTRSKCKKCGDLAWYGWGRGHLIACGKHREEGMKGQASRFCIREGCLRIAQNSVPGVRGYLCNQHYWAEVSGPSLVLSHVLGIDDLEQSKFTSEESTSLSTSTLAAWVFAPFLQPILLRQAVKPEHRAREDPTESVGQAASEKQYPIGGGSFLLPFPPPLDQKADEEDGLGADWEYLVSGVGCSSSKGTETSTWQAYVESVVADNTL
jgi:hypothetical protein